MMGSAEIKRSGFSLRSAEFALFSNLNRSENENPPRRSPRISNLLQNETDVKQIFNLFKNNADVKQIFNLLFIPHYSDIISETRYLGRQLSRTKARRY